MEDLPCLENPGAAALSRHADRGGLGDHGLSTPYLDYLVTQTEEVMQRYPDADGIFMDTSWQFQSNRGTSRG